MGVRMIRCAGNLDVHYWALDLGYCLGVSRLSVDNFE
jgi:hypothetical protein